MIVKNGDAVVLDDDTVYAIMKTFEYNNTSYALVQKVNEDIAYKRELDSAFEIVEEKVEDDKVKLVPVKDVLLKTMLIEKFNLACKL